MRARTLAAGLVSTLCIVVAFTAVAPTAEAQGQRGSKPVAAAPVAKPGPSAKPAVAKPKKQVTSAQAVTISREILVKYGFQVVRVESVGGAEVIYYRRGNNGRGRGLGPVEKMVIRPSGTVVVIESAPDKVLIDIKLRLGL